MCKIIAECSKEEKEKEIKGYKIAIEIDGKFYSPSTGIEYKVGKISIPKTDGREYSKVLDYTGLINPMFDEVIYDKRHEGLTQIFIDKPKEIDIKLITYKNGVLLEMTGYPVYHGLYQGDKTILIKEILSMKKVMYD